MDVQSSMPSLNQKIAVDDGALAGEEVYGIRYEAPEHMSGWYVTSDSYDGNIANLKVIDLFSFLPKRKDLIQFLALPPGYEFQIREGKYDVWSTP
ncbi:hypothetical protein L3C95_16005 [Chitinophaga filiformis]|uniref:immunity protein Imm33 domain-containing protein n=1 Tax=Chitinophaga filiformis TaxID=104663 RepID=UPI001F1B8451|nr:hypothetical protein [Chitinophaga filiformis]MCF6404402.1 hypothetical protein [Chitinophaga filiformis]